MALAAGRQLDRLAQIGGRQHLPGSLTGAIIQPCAIVGDQPARLFP